MKFLTPPLTKKKKKKKKKKDSKTPEKFSLVTNYDKLSLLTFMVRP